MDKEKIVDFLRNVLVIIIFILFFYIIIPIVIIRNNRDKIIIFFHKVKRKLIYLKIMKKKKIICKLTDVPKTVTRKGFLREFLKKLPATYTETGAKQCNADSNRSFTDLLELTKDRFPKTSLNTVVRIIAQLNIEKLCILVWCNQINRFVVVGKGHPNVKGKAFFSTYCNNYYKSKVGTDGISYAELVKIRKQEQVS